MHKYLKTVGFSEIKNRKQVEEIIYDVVKNYDEKAAVRNQPEGIFAEFTKYYGSDYGISVCGVFEESENFHVEYYYPFFRGTGITTQEKVTVERHSDKQSFAGACDDLRIGITLIFYLQNPVEYMQAREENRLKNDSMPLTLSCMASEGKILFPVMKDKEAVKVEKEASRNRNHLIAAAREGDEEAMESLTMEDMDMYSIISQRIRTEDVLSIVDSYFMPHGIECDQYNILGEIRKLKVSRNTRTGEEVVAMSIESNDMTYDVCINRGDLLGEPEVGRRFKGTVWLQGKLHY